MRFMENLPSDLGCKRQQVLTPCPWSNTTGMAKLFHHLCPRGIEDKPEKGGLLLKAGTEERQHIVGIRANGQVSLFQLVYVEARRDDR